MVWPTQGPSQRPAPLALHPSGTLSRELEPDELDHNPFQDGRHWIVSRGDTRGQSTGFRAFEASHDNDMSPAYALRATPEANLRRHGLTERKQPGALSRKGAGRTKHRQDFADMLGNAVDACEAEERHSGCNEQPSKSLQKRRRGLGLDA